MKEEKEQQLEQESEDLSPLFTGKFSFNFSLPPHLIESVQKASLEIGKIFTEVSKSLYEALAPILEIDWEKAGKRWLELAEKLAQKGWTVPLNMGISEMFDILELNSRYKIDKAFEEFYSKEENYIKVKEELLKNEFLHEWKELLEQCFENFEKGNYIITIPSLFTVIEGFAHKLIYPRYKHYEEPNEKQPPSLSRKYTIVRQEVESTSAQLALYASAHVFIRKAFQFERFDAKRPSLINRNWVLHGRDNPSQWRKIDSIRLINTISTLTALDFLLVAEKETTNTGASS